MNTLHKSSVLLFPALLRKTHVLHSGANHTDPPGLTRRIKRRAILKPRFVIIFCSVSRTLSYAALFNPNAQDALVIAILPANISAETGARDSHSGPNICEIFSLCSCEIGKASGKASLLTWTPDARNEYEARKRSIKKT